MKPDCFFVGPYTPPECVPWPKNDHEAHVIVAIWLATWTLGLFLMLWMDHRLAKQAQAEARTKKQDDTLLAVVANQDR